MLQVKRENGTEKKKKKKKCRIEQPRADFQLLTEKRLFVLHFVLPYVTFADIDACGETLPRSRGIKFIGY